MRLAESSTVVAVRPAADSLQLPVTETVSERPVAFSRAACRRRLNVVRKLAASLLTAASVCVAAMRWAASCTV